VVQMLFCLADLPGLPVQPAQAQMTPRHDRFHLTAARQRKGFMEAAAGDRDIEVLALRCYLARQAECFCFVPALFVRSCQRYATSCVRVCVNEYSSWG
jgi:hypothetical protein